MKAQDFFALALELPGSKAGEHQNHPDFRVNGKVFASLGYPDPDPDPGMVALTPDQQAELVRSHPDAFSPAAGAWGRRGYTTVRLAAARKDVVRRAFKMANENRATPE